MSREAMKLALDALVFAAYEDIEYDDACDQKVREARNALRQALAQPEQEPVGWYDSISGEMDFTFYRPTRKPSSPSAKWIPVYTAPPKQWVGLTDEEINSVYYKRDWTAHWTNTTFARAIEAKLKEKNHG